MIIKLKQHIKLLLILMLSTAAQATEEEQLVDLLKKISVIAVVASDLSTQCVSAYREGQEYAIPCQRFADYHAEKYQPVFSEVLESASHPLTDKEKVSLKETMMKFKVHQWEMMENMELISEYAGAFKNAQ